MTEYELGFVNLFYFLSDHSYCVGGRMLVSVFHDGICIVKVHKVTFFIVSSWKYVLVCEVMMLCSWVLSVCAAEMSF